MMFVMLAVAVVCFVILPIYFLYDMFANPIPGAVRARYMEGYQWDTYDTACDYVFGAAALFAFLFLYVVTFKWLAS